MTNNPRDLMLGTQRDISKPMSAHDRYLLDPDFHAFVTVIVAAMEDDYAWAVDDAVAAARAIVAARKEKALQRETIAILDHTTQREQ